MEKIWEESYFSRPNYWQQRANELGKLEIYDNKTAKLSWILYPENERVTRMAEDIKSDENKRCKYCQSEVRESLDDAGYAEIEAWIDIDATILILNHLNEIGTHIRINYCPMCGRKLR